MLLKLEKGPYIHLKNIQFFVFDEINMSCYFECVNLFYRLVAIACLKMTFRKKSYLILTNTNLQIIWLVSKYNFLLNEIFDKTIVLHLFQETKIIYGSHRSMH